MSSHPTPRRISALPEDVINKIAAGEVIQRPSSVVKELLENALDAKATSITVTVRDGGLKLIQIQDDGHGIHKEDLSLLCQRFATSKLQSVEDLLSIATYGFRGEALASVSFVANLAVTTKTAESQCAYKAEYRDGSLLSAPKPLAGNRGTTFQVENLFYNMSTRRSALQTTSDEYGRIAEVVSRYAVHNPHVAMCLKKSGEMCFDVRTQATNSTVANVAMVYGFPLSKELLPLQICDQALKFEASGYISNLNHTLKKMNFLLFINDRLVDSQPLRRSIEQAYAVYLLKGVHPFVYLSLKIAPNQVDVNVHPTKSEVQFLHHDEIIGKVVSEIESLLSSANQSRPFPAKTVSVSPAPRPNIYLQSPAPPKGNVSKRPYEHELVRTDSKERKIESFLVSSPLIGRNRPSQLPDRSTSVAAGGVPMDQQPSTSRVDPEDEYLANMDLVASVDPGTSTSRGTIDFAFERAAASTAGPGETVNTDGDGLKPKLLEMVPKEKNMFSLKEVDNGAEILTSPEAVRELHKRSTGQASVDWRPIRLRSVAAMQQTICEMSCPDKRSIVKNHTYTICEMSCPDKRSIVKNHTYVGSIDPRLSLLQAGTSLYLVDVQLLSWYHFYQSLVFGFGNFGVIRLDEPVPIVDMALVALRLGHGGPWSETGKSDLETAVQARDSLRSKAAMLWDYYSLEVSGDAIHSLPLLLSDYAPQMEGIGRFILDLALKVDWTAERPCFEGISEAIASFYFFQRDLCDGTNTSRLTKTPWPDVVEHVLLPAFKLRLLPPKADDQAFIRLADLHDLYKVFERC